MRTRTLLVLAVVVGLLILVAGGIQLLRVSDEPSGTDDLAIGDSARAGDLDVTVVSAAEQDGVMRVRVRIGGVDDAQGLDDFTLVGIGAAVRASVPDDTDTGACRAITAAEQMCTLAFPTSALEGSARVLLVRRGEDQHRWSLQ